MWVVYVVFNKFVPTLTYDGTIAAHFVPFAGDAERPITGERPEGFVYAFLTITSHWPGTLMRKVEAEYRAGKGVKGYLVTRLDALSGLAAGVRDMVLSHLKQPTLWFLRSGTEVPERDLGHFIQLADMSIGQASRSSEEEYKKYCVKPLVTPSEASDDIIRYLISQDAVRVTLMPELFERLSIFTVGNISLGERYMVAPVSDDTETLVVCDSLVNNLRERIANNIISAEDVEADAAAVAERYISRIIPEGTEGFALSRDEAYKVVMGDARVKTTRIPIFDSYASKAAGVASGRTMRVATIDDGEVAEHHYTEVLASPGMSGMFSEDSDEEAAPLHPDALVREAITHPMIGMQALNFLTNAPYAPLTEKSLSRHAREVVFTRSMERATKPEFQTEWKCRVLAPAIAKFPTMGSYMWDIGTNGRGTMSLEAGAPYVVQAQLAAIEIVLSCPQLTLPPGMGWPPKIESFSQGRMADTDDDVLRGFRPPLLALYMSFWTLEAFRGDSDWATDAFAFARGLLQINSWVDVIKTVVKSKVSDGTRTMPGEHVSLLSSDAGAEVEDEFRKIVTDYADNPEMSPFSRMWLSPYTEMSRIQAALLHTLYFTLPIFQLKECHSYMLYALAVHLNPAAYMGKPMKTDRSIIDQLPGKRVAFMLS